MRKQQGKTGNLEIIDTNGELLEYHFLDSKGNPSRNFAKIVYEYDSLKFLIREKYYKPNGRLYQYSSGVAMKRYLWNGARNILMIENYDSLENRTVDKKIGASLIRYRYDSLKRVREVTYFDRNNKRSNNTEGHSRKEFLFEPIVMERYYDTNDLLVKVADERIN